MSRIASIHLPLWPIERLARANGQAPDGPFALVQGENGGLRITAVNPAAHALGISKGEALPAAKARLPSLLTQTAAPEQDRAALIKLAHWLTRFTPWTAPWPEDWAGPGLFLDITGSDHLFGGEEKLARLILQRLQSFGFSARIAIADTPGAAYALACHGAAKKIIIAPGRTEDAVRDLPVQALRIAADTAQALRHLGLKRVGDLLPLPRAPLAARFGGGLLTRLDQIVGRAGEPISPLAPVPAYRSAARLAEPISAEAHILIVMERLAKGLMPALERDGVGARALRLVLYRVDGETATLTLKLAQASRDLSHIETLFALRLESIKTNLDAGFGFEAALLEALVTEPLAKTQADLAASHVEENGLSPLIDRLGTRLGVENVTRIFPRQSHIPERAVMLKPAFHPDPDHWPEMDAPRPLLMLPVPEPAEVIASFPEGAPRQFRWRGVRYGITHAEGPERIRPEWWQRQSGLTRDYYVLEDEAGRRFWLYRDGLYYETPSPDWFVHGVFA